MELLFVLGNKEIIFVKSKENTSYFIQNVGMWIR